MSTAVIIGAGSGLSASLARALAGRGHDLVLAARNTDKVDPLLKETGARAVALDAADPVAVADLFADLSGDLRVAIYNPSHRIRGGIAELDPEQVRRAVEVTAFGAFLMARAAVPLMRSNDGETKGTILFTGASAGVKGFANSSVFAMGKFAQRGLAQSLSRELHPEGIHVAWINIDGAIATHDTSGTEDGREDRLDPDAIAQTYLNLIDQHRSAWSHEIAVRPWTERF